MLRLAFRTLVARRRRALTTTFAVLLGVTLAASTIALTESLDRSLTERSSAALAGIDVVVGPRQFAEPTVESPPSLPAAVLERVRAVDGVGIAAGQLFSPTWIFDARGRPVGSSLAPDLLASALPARLGAQRYVRGRAPRGDDEAAIDDLAAARAGVGIGDAVRAGVRRYRVAGIVRLGETPYPGGSVLVLTQAAAARAEAKEGRLDRIVVAARRGTTPAQLRDRIARALPRDAEALTAAQVRSRRSDEAGTRLSVVQAGLFTLAGASLFVSAFLIFNTFSITVAQRLRELALLRTLGASRRQVQGVVLAEALGIGIIGSLLGLLGGVASLPLLRAVVKGFDVALPLDDLAMTPNAVALAVALGLGVTVAAAYLPARRASRVSPLEALRVAELPPPERRPVRRALVLLGIGTALLAWALLGDLGLAGWLPGFVGVILVGAALLGSRLVSPIAQLVALPLQLLFGISGRIARRNATRHPRRTAITASSLALGVTIIAFAMVLTTSYERTSVATIDLRHRGQVVVEGFREGATLPAAVEPALRRVPGVAGIGAMSVVQATRVDQELQTRVNGIDPATASRTFRFRWKEGSPRTLDRLGNGDAVVVQGSTSGESDDVGDRVALRTPDGRIVRYRIVGVLADDPNAQLGSLIATRATLRRDFGRDPLLTVAARLAPGAAPADVARAARAAVGARFPVARVLEKTELRQRFIEESKDFRRLVFATLSLAILVSILGIANTISLSIHERTREIGMLRAIGASRRDIRSMIGQEGVVTGLVGGSVGAALGTALGAVLVAPLGADGFLFAFPTLQLAAMVGLTLLAGLAAAFLPARRAAGIGILDAAADA